MSKRKSFLIHIDSLDVLDDLTDEESGKLFKAIKDYQNESEPELSGILKIAFSPFRNQFARDKEKYELTCKRRAQAGSKGGKQKVANASKSKQKVANVAESDSKNKNDSKNDSDSESKNDRFDEFWGLYGRKVDTKKCRAKFNKLKESDIDKIFEVLPDYIASTPDKQYRKLPATWLNGECWNDEIQKPLLPSDPVDCGIDFDALIENFNNSMKGWENVPVAQKVTPKQKEMIAILVRDYEMTNERFKAYFNYISEDTKKFGYFIDGVNMPAQGLTFFLKEDTIQR